MQTSQRRLIVASLVTLAVALASYCLDYQTREAYRVGDQLFEAHPFGPVPLVASPILMNFGEAPRLPTAEEAFGPPPADGRRAGNWFSAEVQVHYVTVRGLYPHGDMTSAGAALGGLLMPLLLLAAAGYFGLGARSDGGGSETLPEGGVVEAPPVVASPSPPSSPPAWAAGAGRVDASELLAKMAIVATVLAPVFFVLDMPSLMLLNRLRFQRWVFALLVLRALANPSGGR